MPSRLKRYYTGRDLHFITCSCYRRSQLGTARRRELFVRILEHTRQRYQFVVVGYVVMPKHFHLLISEPENADLSGVMKVVKQRFARRVQNRRSGAQLVLWPEVDGPSVWDKRFMTSTCGRRASDWKKVALSPSEPGEAGTGVVARAVGVEQFSSVRLRRDWNATGELSGAGVEGQGPDATKLWGRSAAS